MAACLHASLPACCYMHLAQACLIRMIMQSRGVAAVTSVTPCSFSSCTTTTLKATSAQSAVPTWVLYQHRSILSCAAWFLLQCVGHMATTHATHRWACLACDKLMLASEQQVSVSSGRCKQSMRFPIAEIGWSDVYLAARGFELPF